MSTENRRSKRRAPDYAIPVTNCMTEAPIGQIGNVSIGGLMLQLSISARQDALYQVSFPLPAGQATTARTIEVGIHEQWNEASNVPGQYWAGFRIIDIAPSDRVALNAWIEAG